MLCGFGASSFLFSIISIVSIVRGKLKSSTASHSTQLNSPEGMQCVLKKIMNCHEVPYSLITKKNGISTIYPHMGSGLTS